jgi:hypothetical protein
MTHPASTPKHYKETDHPVVILFQHPHPGWCYVHRRTV